MTIEFPANCFISHSYRDRSGRKKLIKSLPKHVRPYVFPPIDVQPDDMVSNSLVEAILDQDALIFLQGGNSDHSFWVAFERDYALRAGMPVYAFNPQTRTFHPYQEKPLQLPVFISHSPYDRDQVNEIVRFMREDRFFDAASFNFLPSTGAPRNRPVPTDKRIRQNIIEKISRGGYVVAFLSKQACESSYVREEMELALDFGRFFTLDQSNPNSRRVLLALLDATPLPEWLAERMRTEPDSVVKPVQLYGDKTLSTTNRIDDLIVRLYWLIYRNTRQNSLV
ncbi:MAG: toll/interleukin-1 receptor domain-containing protein [Anaerolineaceae bacterium]|nr:toll/interleukin-1 receptor domain-containing protein [Anaerolineaceae bacterium]